MASCAWPSSPSFSSSPSCAWPSPPGRMMMMMMRRRRSSSSLASLELTFYESLCTTVDCCCCYSANGKHRVEKFEELYELYMSCKSI